VKVAKFLYNLLTGKDVFTITQMTEISVLFVNFSLCKYRVCMVSGKNVPPVIG